MDSLRKLESIIAGWYANVPHLSLGGRQWLADNIWWIALISVIFGVIGLFMLVPSVLLAVGLSAGISEVNGMVYEHAFFWLIVLVSFVSLVLTTVLTALAIAALKDKKKFGWDLLFLSLIAGFIIGIVNNLLQFVLMSDIYGFLSVVTGLIVAAFAFVFSMYFLFEIRAYFSKGKVTDRKPVVKVRKTATKNG